MKRLTRSPIPPSPTTVGAASGRGSRRLSMRSRAGAVSTMALCALGAAACLDRPVEPLEPRTTSTIIERLLQTAVDKIDILLALDNSASMADKQEILAATIPDLVKALVNPRCIDPQDPTLPDDDIVQTPGPATPKEPCAQGFTREFDPIVDIHIGIISSSLGGHGADACSPANSNFNTTQADMGHLIFRKLGGGDVPTYSNLGFLAWDPDGKLEPPGEASLTNLEANLKDLVVGVDQSGCGYEAQLESWYRFLVEPDPYDKITVDANGIAIAEGTDAVLLKQRSDFLRANSLLAIVMLTDENDCSIVDGGQNWYAVQMTNGGQQFVLPRGTAVCETNPNDPCCRSCGIPHDPPGCTPLAADTNCQAPFTAQTDSINLRCWQQKRRFGIDFMWPVHRYVAGLKNQVVKNRHGVDTQNPIFMDLKNNSGVSQRDASLVFLAGIIGVPWQDIARDPADLKKGYLTAAELNAQKRWDVILGDPDKNILPTDPLMIESISPRVGTNPITGFPLKPPDSPPMDNPINGHEWNISNMDDLQYACIFDLPNPRDCGTVQTNCDCKNLPAGSNNPLCQDPSGAYDKIQRRAKAYPGLRELQVLRGIGDQAIVASICPVETKDTNRADYGYRPAVGAIIDRLKSKLAGKCLPRQLEVATDGPTAGQAPCIIMEARPLAGEACSCLGLARQEVQPEHKAAERFILDPEHGGMPAGSTCICEVMQASGQDLIDCQNDPNNPPTNQATNQPVHGWCYVDQEIGLGNPAIVEKCGENEKRIIRFVGEGKGAPGATLFITCQQKGEGEL